MAGLKSDVDAAASEAAAAAVVVLSSAGKMLPVDYAPAFFMGACLLQGVSESLQQSNPLLLLLLRLLLLLFRMFGRLVPAAGSRLSPAGRTQWGCHMWLQPEALQTQVQQNAAVVYGIMLCCQGVFGSRKGYARGFKYEVDTLYEQVGQGTSSLQWGPGSRDVHVIGKGV